MFFGPLFVIFIVCFASDITHGQRDKKFFRKDYTYLEATDSFYKIHEIPSNWFDAKRLCELEGATLFYPENKNESDAVISFWKSSHDEISHMYMGLSDMLIEGMFEAVDGKSIYDVYINWRSGEPSNSGKGEDCAILYKNGLVNDIACERKFSFTCKKSCASLEWNYPCGIPNQDYIFNKDIGKCYKFHKTSLSWPEAFAVCNAEQSSLAMITNRMEADYLATITESAPRAMVTGNYMRGIYHLGFHNRFNNGWHTVKGTPLNVSASAWWGGFNPEICSSPLCGSMFFNGLLNYNDCDTRCFFICEHEGSNITTTINEELSTDATLPNFNNQ